MGAKHNENPRCGLASAANSHRAALAALALLIAPLALLAPASCSKQTQAAKPAAPAETPKPAVKVVAAPQAAQAVPAPASESAQAAGAPATDAAASSPPATKDATKARPAGNGAAIAPSATPNAAAAKTPAPPRPALAAAMRAFGLAAPPKPRMPEDYSLGPLQSFRPEKGAESDSFAAALAFMDAYAQGKLDKAALLPEAREALAVLLAPPPAATGAAPYRLGRAKVEGQAASYLVRLPRVRDAPRVEGLLSLRAVEGRWYVEALALDPPAPAQLAFDPSALDARKIDGN